MYRLCKYDYGVTQPKIIEHTTNYITYVDVNHRGCGDGEVTERQEGKFHKWFGTFNEAKTYANDRGEYRLMLLRKEVDTIEQSLLSINSAQDDNNTTEGQ